MSTDRRCVCCGREFRLWHDDVESLRDLCGNEIMCPFCAELYGDGYLARKHMLPMELCPWEGNRRDIVAVLGPHGDSGARCPWCAGWADMEQVLFGRAR